MTVPEYRRPPFIHGLELAQRFYDEAVQPLLDSHFPDLAYAAARLAGGSDVLGFDTPQSRDHDWGPRLTIFLEGNDFKNTKEALDSLFRHKLPREVAGYPTHFAYHEDGATMFTAAGSGPVNHLIRFETVESFFRSYLAYNPGQPLTIRRWLTFPEQRLRTIAYGRIFHDGPGRLTAVRQQLAYYPHDLWLYLLVVQWGRIAQEEAFLGRTGDVGDDLGSRILAARLIRDLMKLSFLMEKQYAPYSKWFGTAFSRLACAARLAPLFEEALKANDWRSREKQMSAAYQSMAEMHNELQITPPLKTKVSSFHDRPYQVIHAEHFCDAIYREIKDEDVLALPHGIGAIDQFVDSTDILSEPARFTQFEFIYNNS